MNNNEISFQLCLKCNKIAGEGCECPKPEKTTPLTDEQMGKVYHVADGVILLSLDGQPFLPIELELYQISDL